MADLGYQKPFMQPGSLPTQGGGGGGRASQRTWGLQPYQSKGPSPYGEIGGRRPAPVNIDRLDYSAQVFGRLAQLIGGAVGSAWALTAAVGSFTAQSQLQRPNLDVGWSPRGLADLDMRHNGWDALIVPEEESYVPRSVPLSPNAPSRDTSPSRPIMNPSGGGATTSRPVHAVDPVEQPVQDPGAVQRQIDEENARWAARVSQHEAAVADFQNRQDAWVQRELAEREAEQWRKLQAEHEATLARIAAERQNSLSVSFAPQPNGALAVRTRLREAYDFRLQVPRKKDQKARPQLVRVVNALITATYGTYSEIVDALEALVWNVYVLDKRGRPVQAMLVYNRNMAYVLTLLWEGRARADLFGFALDFTVNQWSDAMYAFQSQKVDAIALDLGWKAPIGINSYAHKGFHRTEGQRDVSSEWIRSSSRFIRSLDHGRAARVQSLFRVPRS